MVVTKAIVMLQDDMCDNNSEFAVRQLQANILRAQDAVGKDLTKQIGDLMCMVDASFAAKKITNMGDLPAICDKTVFKVLDMSIASVVVSAQKLVSDGCVSHPGQCRIALEWAKGHLADPTSFPTSSWALSAKVVKPCWT